MTNAILRGKPYAGNPHVLFDEGGVASAKPSRVSLLRKRLIVAGVLVASAVVRAAEYNLPKGSSETIDTAATYEKMTIGGDLTVNGGVTVSTPLTLLGANADESATIAVSGKSTFFKSDRLVVGGMDGGTGKITSSDGGLIYIGQANADGNRLEIAQGAEPDSGDVIDLVSLGAGDHRIARLANLSSYPARLKFSSGARLVLATAGATWYATAFGSGNWVLEADAPAEIQVYCSPYLTFAASSAHVRAAGSGLFHVYGGASTYESVRMTFANAGGFTLDKGCVFPFVAGKVDMSAMRGPMTVNGTLSVKNNPVYADGLVIGSAGSITTSSNQAFTFGSGDRDGSLSATIPSSNRVVKVGSGTLTVTGASSAGPMIVSNGTLKVTAPLAVETLTLEAGTALIVDGVTLTLGHLEQNATATISTINGGEIVYGGEALTEIIRPSLDGDFTKVGSARTTIYEPGSATAKLHVSEGELAFSKFGLSQRYWRWTFKGVSNGPSSLTSLGKLWLHGADGNRVGDGIAYASYGAVNTDLSSKDAYKGKATWICSANTNVDQNVAKDGSVQWHQDCFSKVNNLFIYTDPVNNFPWPGSPVIDKGNPDSYLGLEFRLRDTDGPIVGYNFGLTTTGRGRPTDWTVEVSDDGKVWTSVDVRSDMPLPSEVYGAFWDGTILVNNTLPDPPPTETFHFMGYLREGLTPLATPLSVQVDEEAKLNLKAFTGGQSVGTLTYDAALGAGEIENAVFAANGTLYYTSASGKPARGTVLPYVLTNCSGVENLEAWSVVINGKATSWRVSIQNGQLTLVPPGLFIVFE